MNSRRYFKELRLDWIRASEQKPAKPALVLYLEPFFGKLDPKMTVAYYDELEGWKQDISSAPLYHVSHWCPLPDGPNDPALLEVTQENMKEDDLNTVTLP